MVICAGLQSDRLSRLADGEDGPRIVPFRGEYLAVREAKRELVRGMVYPVPDPRYPFLGVHFTRRVSGALEVGPNAVLALSREGYRWGAVRPARPARHGRLAGILADGAGALADRLARSCAARSRSGPYMRAASRYVPEIGAGDVIRAGAGVRAQAVDRDGSLVDDFRITGSDGVTCIRNAPSPAATSSLAIAGYVVDRMDRLP